MAEIDVTEDLVMEDAFTAYEEVEHAASAQPEEDWVMDSAATKFMTSHIEILHDIHPIKPRVIHLAGEDKTLIAKQARMVYIRTEYGRLVVEFVLYVLGLRENLFSLTPLIQVFSPTGVDILNSQGRQIARAVQPKGHGRWFP